MHEGSSDRSLQLAPQTKDVMTEILRAGAQKMLAEMIQAEVEEWLAQRAQLRDGEGPAGSGARPAAGRRGGALLLEDLAAVPAKDQERRGVDSLAVLEGRQHGRFRRSPSSPPGAERRGAAGDARHPAKTGSASSS